MTDFIKRTKRSEAMNNPHHTFIQYQKLYT
mgnify:CR=1 FL=1